MTEPPAISTVLLELQVSDFNKVKVFYSQLGFSVVWERQPDGFKGYLVIKFENNILCFWGGMRKFTSRNILRNLVKILQREMVLS